MRGIDAIGVEPHLSGAWDEAPYGVREKSGSTPIVHWLWRDPCVERGCINLLAAVPSMAAQSVYRSKQKVYGEL